MFDVMAVQVAYLPSALLVDQVITMSQEFVLPSAQQVR